MAIYIAAGAPIAGITQTSQLQTENGWQPLLVVMPAARMTDQEAAALLGDAAYIKDERETVDYTYLFPCFHSVHQTETASCIWFTYASEVGSRTTNEALADYYTTTQEVLA